MIKTRNKILILFNNLLFINKINSTETEIKNKQSEEKKKEQKDKKRLDIKNLLENLSIKTGIKQEKLIYLIIIIPIIFIISFIFILIRNSKSNMLLFLEEIEVNRQPLNLKLPSGINILKYLNFLESLEKNKLYIKENGSYKFQIDLDKNNRFTKYEKDFTENEKKIQKIDPGNKKREKVNSFFFVIQEAIEKNQLSNIKDEHRLLVKLFSEIPIYEKKSKIFYSIQQTDKYIDIYNKDSKKIQDDQRLYKNIYNALNSEYLIVILEDMERNNFFEKKNDKYEWKKDKAQEFKSFLETKENSQKKEENIKKIKEIFTDFSTMLNNHLDLKKLMEKEMEKDFLDLIEFFKTIPLQEDIQLNEKEKKFLDFL